jgi:hypothetical protein
MSLPALEAGDPAHIQRIVGHCRMSATLKDGKPTEDDLRAALEEAKRVRGTQMVSGEIGGSSARSNPCRRRIGLLLIGSATHQQLDTWCKVSMPSYRSYAGQQDTI